MVGHGHPQWKVFAHCSRSMVALPGLVREKANSFVCQKILRRSHEITRREFDSRDIPGSPRLPTAGTTICTSTIGLYHGPNCKAIVSSRRWIRLFYRATLVLIIHARTIRRDISFDSEILLNHIVVRGCAWVVLNATCRLETSTLFR
ncbi:hypothetical protein EVAR_20068_1 [Eumeta japonica]|uniref:Uncharacterized protein n=1 Tax=Eumeta variegata TaxID=151549 RepID=A0A4C1UJI7_EUMVA|nr:hypothetical protein EVAR_20068_1 [Eumeta japonica]